MSRRLVLRFTVTDGDGTEREVSLVGQYARTLRALIDAGAKGITAVDVSNTWALRLGHYIWVLRHKHRLTITTAWEPHDGVAGPGRHGRYTLHTQARLLTDEREAA